MATATETTCRTDDAFSEALEALVKPKIAERAREVARAIVEALDYEDIAETVWGNGDLSGANIGASIAAAINQHLVEEVFPSVTLPDGCDY